MKKIISLVLALVLTGMSSPVQAQRIEKLSLQNWKPQKRTFSVPLNTESPALSPTQAAEEFYKNRAKKLLTHGQRAALSYAQKYDHMTGSVYPPTFWNDKIQGVAPYDTEGVLFTFALRETYDTLKDAAPLDIPSVTDKTIAYLVLHTRDVDVAKISPFYEKKGDPWFTAFALMGQYDQLGQFAEKYNNLRGLYREYQHYRQANDWDMVKYYNSHYDFTPIAQKTDVSVFTSRQRDIKNFARGFSNGSYAFLSEVIVPLQTNAVPNADISRYLDANLSETGLPQGLSRAQLKAVIMEKVNAPEDYFAEAEKINPSLLKEMKKTGKSLLKMLGRKGDLQDVFNTLSLFQYAAPSTYIKMVDNMSEGNVTHAQVNRALAESLAAEALDKRLAQIADGLFEIERIFAFNTAGLEEDTIAQNWQKLAAKEAYSSFMIARLAADNIMKSGKTPYQTNKIAAMQLENRKMENAKTNSDVMLFAADFLPLGGLGEVSKAERSAAEATRIARAQKENVLLVKRGLSSLKVEGKAGKRAAQTAKKGKQIATVPKGARTAPLSRAEKAQQGLSKNIISVEQVYGIDDRARAVWSLGDNTGNVVGYYKIGTESEVRRAEIVRELIDGKQGLRAKHTGLEVEYPLVLSRGAEQIPPALYERIARDKEWLKYRVRSGERRMQTGFISSPVDASGMTLADLKYKKIEFETLSKSKASNGLTVKQQMEREIMRQLDGKPLSRKEWEQITDFVQDLNKSGFEHGDMQHNLFIKRNPSTGKIKLTLLDFEDPTEGLLSDAEALSWWQGRLEFYGALH